MRVILAGAVALCAMLPTLAWSVEAQDEESITMNDVPVQVRASAQAAANGSKLDKVGLDLDDGTATYEFSGKNADGKMIEIDVSHEGRIEEFEQEISMDQSDSALACFPPGLSVRSLTVTSGVMTGPMSAYECSSL